MRILVFLKYLDDVRVIKEIERYKWLESERLGRDIGKERAVLEWVQKYGQIWLQINKPEEYEALNKENPLKKHRCYDNLKPYERKTLEIY